MRHFKELTMKFTKLLLLLIFFVSCKSNKSIVGLYGKCPNHYYACSQIELKANNTFEYFIFMDVGGANILKGNWKKTSNDSILLNTFEQPTIPKTSYIGIENASSVKKIKISDKNGPIIFAGVSINDNNNWKVTDIDGVVEFNENEINSISVISLGIKENILVENKNLDEIHVIVKDPQTGVIPEYLIDYKLKISNDKIFITEKYSLKKTKITYKQW